MADKKISDLTELALADIDPNNDLLVIVDMSAGETKKAKYSILQGPPGATGATGATGGSIPNNGAVTIPKLSSDFGPLAGNRNKIINGNFRINQRVYVSGATLASGAFGHDRWKAGSSGGDYTFTQTANGMAITIASSKSLLQVIEDANIEGGDYVLSWTGTSQARVGLNGAAPSGTPASSPILITGQNASAALTVEFNAGTVSKVQLEQGVAASTFEQRPIQTELLLCQRYYEKSYDYSAALGSTAAAGRCTTMKVTTGEWIHNDWKFAVQKRAVPTIRYWDVAGNATRVSAYAVGSNSRTDNASYTFNITASQRGFLAEWISGGASIVLGFHYDASAEL